MVSISIKTEPKDITTARIVTQLHRVCLSFDDIPFGALKLDHQLDPEGSARENARRAAAELARQEDSNG